MAGATRSHTPSIASHLTTRASAAGACPPATQHLPYLGSPHQPPNSRARSARPLQALVRRPDLVLFRPSSVDFLLKGGRLLGEPLHIGRIVGHRSEFRSPGPWRQRREAKRRPVNDGNGSTAAPDVRGRPPCVRARDVELGTIKMGTNLAGALIKSGQPRVLRRYVGVVPYGPLLSSLAFGHAGRSDLRSRPWAKC